MIDIKSYHSVGTKMRLGVIDIIIIFVDLPRKVMPAHRIGDWGPTEVILEIV